MCLSIVRYPHELKTSQFTPLLGEISTYSGSYDLHNSRFLIPPGIMGAGVVFLTSSPAKYIHSEMIINFNKVYAKLMIRTYFIISCRLIMLYV